MTRSAHINFSKTFNRGQGPRIPGTRASPDGVVRKAGMRVPSADVLQALEAYRVALLAATRKGIHRRASDAVCDAEFLLGEALLGDDK